MSNLERGPTDREDVLKQQLVNKVMQRQTNGQSTALRDLHDLLQTPQSLALRMAQCLADEGRLIIEKDATDAFGSLVSLPAFSINAKGQA